MIYLSIVSLHDHSILTDAKLVQVFIAMKQLRLFLNNRELLIHPKTSSHFIRKSNLTVKNCNYTTE